MLILLPNCPNFKDTISYCSNSTRPSRTSSMAPRLHPSHSEITETSASKGSLSNVFILILPLHVGAALYQGSQNLHRHVTRLNLSGPVSSLYYRLLRQSISSPFFRMIPSKAFITSMPLITCSSFSLPSLCPTLPSRQTNITCKQLRVCRQCKKTFSEAENNPRACRYHSGLYTGDSRRKGVWVDTYEKGTGTAERFWW